MTDNEWDADRYDEACGFVSSEAADLLDLLAVDADDRVLDLGCGTGEQAGTLAERGVTVVGLDSAPEMVERAREAHPDVEFVLADARTYGTGEPFDAVLSNAMLHWVPVDDQPAVARTVARALRPGGRFVAELGATGNVARVREALAAELRERGRPVPDPWYFPTVGEHTTLLEEAGFEVRLARLFDRPTDIDGTDGLADWLAAFGDPYFEAVPDGEREAVVAGVEDRLRPDLFDAEETTWTLDYRRLRFVAVR